MSTDKEAHEHPEAAAAAEADSEKSTPAEESTSTLAHASPSPPESDADGDEAEGEFADADDGEAGAGEEEEGEAESSSKAQAGSESEPPPGSKRGSEARVGDADTDVVKAEDQANEKGEAELSKTADSSKAGETDTAASGQTHDKSTQDSGSSPATPAKKSSPGVAALMARFQQSDSGSASGSTPPSPTPGSQTKLKAKAAKWQQSPHSSPQSSPKLDEGASGGDAKEAEKSQDSKEGGAKSLGGDSSGDSSIQPATAASTSTSTSTSTDSDSTRPTEEADTEAVNAATTETGPKAETAASIQPATETEAKPADTPNTQLPTATPTPAASAAPSEVTAAAVANGDSVPADYKIPPSQGAVSLLDPAAEIIENPFRSSTPRPGEGSQDDGTLQVERSAAAEHPSSSPWRESIDSMGGASIWQNEGKADGSNGALPQSLASELAMSPGAASASGASNHFSVVSLSSSAAAPGEGASSSSPSSSAARGSKRDTMMAIGETYKGGPPGPNGKRISSQQFQERMRARVDGGEGSKRGSTEGLDKLRENFEKIQQRERNTMHSREPSNATIPGAEVIQEGSNDTTTADAPPDDGEGSDVDWDFWGRVMSNYHQVAQENPHELSAAIQAGIPAQLRGLCWQLLSASKDEEMEIIYAFYIRQSSPHEKQIRKDLSRTFPEQDYFKDGKGIGQENLFNVVKAYSLYDTECGYCQGMGFVCSVLLLNMPDEEAFSTLVRLMKSYGLRGHFLPNMPGLQLRLFQFDRLLEDMLPLLHRHLTRQGIKASMYATQWFMTLFSYRFPLDLVYRILDSVFAEGIEAIFRFAMALMQRSEEALLELNFEQALAYLKGSSVFDVYKVNATPAADPPRYNVDAFAQEAYAVQITPYMLDGYAAEFEEQVKAANAHRREVEALRLVNRNLASRVASLEEQLQQINAEHVDLVKEAVMSKIAKEEMEEELIRYKMLFAEASLRADQAGESTRTSRSASSHDTTQSRSVSGAGSARRSDGTST